MKNKFLILFVILSHFVFFNILNSEEVEIRANDIEFIKDENLTIIKNGNAFIKDEGLLIEGDQIKYYKNQSLILVKNGKISRNNKSLDIKSDTIKYQIDKSNLNFKNNVEITDNINDITINSQEISFNNKNQKITSKTFTEIFDSFGSIYKVSEFEYSIKEKIIKLKNLKILDKDKNTFEMDLGYLNLNKKDLIAKDISINYKIYDNSENDPRLKGRSFIRDENNIIINKGSFTLCKKRDKCPPWELNAEEIRHDKKKKTIYYKNASLKLYDKKVFYFPRFFHPDPSVKRQTGFLIPKIQDNNTTGLSLNTPFFIALAQNKDITLSPRIFADDKLLIQSEYRQKNENSNHIADFSQFFSSDKNSNSHFFYDLEKNFENEKFDEIDLRINLEQVTDETYLKAYKIESPLIENDTNLKNSVQLSFIKDDLAIDTNIDVYEDLSKNDSDKYEYVPNLSFSKIINGNYLFDSQAYYKLYDTNVTEKVIINDIKFESNLKFFQNGLVNEKKFLFKNINTDSNNSTNFKNKQTVELIPTLQTNYFFPLKKETKSFNNIMTPRLSLRISSPTTKDISKNDRTINYDNIYDLNRIGIEETSEGGVSATYGYEYLKIDKTNLEQRLKIGFANNLRLEENKDLPTNTNLGDKVSDFVGLFEYKPNDNFKLNYDFSIKNNLSDTNYELYGFEFFLKNLSTKFEYLNENNTSLKTSYLQNTTKYKLDENNSLIFETRENKEKSFTEFYNLIYQYKNDCLTAGIEYNKEYYNDQDLKPSENLLFKISIIPFGGLNTPNLK